MEKLIIQNFDSIIWKGIAKQLPIIQDGVRKLVINGRTTLFWSDKWLDKLRLKDHVIGSIKLDDFQKRVADYWDGSTWKWSEF